MKPQSYRGKVDGSVARRVCLPFLWGAVAIAAGAGVAASGCTIHADGGVAAQGGVGTSGGVDMEYGIDRPGSDFINFELSSGNPETCRDACARDARCQAYTFVKEGHQGTNARCWLKNAVPSAVRNDCCISGAKGYAASPPPPSNPPAPPPSPVVVSPPPPPPPPPAPPAGPVAGPVMRGQAPSRPPVVSYPPQPSPGPFEHDIDRPGSDIQNFDLPHADPGLCHRACNDNPSCQAFTFVRPGVQGPRPRCWLKNAVPTAVRNPCCVSGVRNPQAIPAPPPPPPIGHDHRHGGRDGDRHDNRRDRRDSDRNDRRELRLEHNVDRPGADFQNFDLPRPDVDLCERACRGNGACRAFTFVRPGVQGPNARCWLKNSVPQAVQNGCCISGAR